MYTHTHIILNIIILNYIIKCITKNKSSRMFCQKAESWRYGKLILYVHSCFD